MEPIVGTTVMATSNDAISEYDIVNENGISIWLTVPDVYTIGRNTHIVVIVDAIIGPSTCFVPCTAALGAESPLFLSLYIFSITTTELSTSIPIPRHRPASDITFMFIPVKYIITSAKSTLNGILNATTTVGLTSLRNNANTIIASIAPITILLKTLEIIFLIKSPWLLRGVIERPLYFPSNSLNESVSAFVTSLVLAVLDL